MKSDRAMGVTFGPGNKFEGVPLQRAAPVIDITRRCPCCGGDGLQSFGYSAYSEVECVTGCRTCDGRGFINVDPVERP